MLTQKLPVASMTGQVREDLPGQNSTSGGSSESAAKDWQAKPTGSVPPSSLAPTAAITVTPVQKCPSALRNRPGSMSVMRSALADGEVVAPQAHGRALARDPVLVFDLPTFTAEFDIEAAR